MNRITSLIILLGASTLAGCAWVQTPKEYANSHGYRPVDLQGKEYYCRLEQPEVQGPPLTGVSCLTRTQLSAVTARANAAPMGSGGLPLDGAMSFESPGIIDNGASTYVNGMGLTGFSGPR
jgi:hypothetical protein